MLRLKPRPTKQEKKRKPKTYPHKARVGHPQRKLVRRERGQLFPLNKRRGVGRQR